MLDKIKFKFGSAVDNPPLEIKAGPVTIIVGPNYSGKSKTLAELYTFCVNGYAYPTDVIVEDLLFKSPSNPEAAIKSYTLSPLQNETIDASSIIVGGGNGRTCLNKEQLIKLVADPNSDVRAYCQQYLNYNIQLLAGSNRISLVSPQQPGNLNDMSKGHFATLFKDNHKMGEVRRIIYDAFKKYLILDPTDLGTLKLRLSDVAPESETQEKGLHADALKFHANALDIMETSDGVKAFTGLITVLIAGDPKIILIDEPEAFLHPPLAYNLGKEVSKSVRGGSKNLIASTHDAHFLMGCVQSGVPLNIIRLTYSNNIATARSLPSEKVAKLMRKPLLRSTGILNGLFYEYVIVTEADSDRAFYEEINERLLQFDPNRGIPNCLFLHAQNKQTVHEIMRPLREMGIPCAAIVDVDIIEDGGSVWTKLLNGANVPDITIKSTANTRSHIKNKLEEKQLKYKTQGGIFVLDANDQNSANDLFDLLDEYGIFTVRNGELESWLKNLEAKGHGPDWLVDIFEKLGEDPTTENYIKPGQGDVWAFLAKIKNWFTNPSRKGNID